MCPLRMFGALLAVVLSLASPSRAAGVWGSSASILAIPCTATTAFEEQTSIRSEATLKRKSACSDTSHRGVATSVGDSHVYDAAIEICGKGTLREAGFYAAVVRALAAEGNVGLADGALVCRGGTCTAERFANGSGVTLDASGRLQGVSVDSANGSTLKELTATIPNKQVGVTTVGDIRALGGDVTPSPTVNKPFHCTLCSITPAQAEDLFTPTVRNPSIP